MKLAKIFTMFTFLLAFAVQISAQDKTPKIVWKNLQEKYERFQDIKPIFVNESDRPIYFNCSVKVDDFLMDSGNFRLMKFYEPEQKWGWNKIVCGNQSSEQIKEGEKLDKKIAKLKKQGKYVPFPPFACKLNSKEEFIVDLGNEQWNLIISGTTAIYGSGKYRFELMYGWIEEHAVSVISKSPEFFVDIKK
jgi:hypothetical protein